MYIPAPETLVPNHVLNSIISSERLTFDSIEQQKVTETKAQGTETR